MTNQTQSTTQGQTTQTTQPTGTIDITATVSNLQDSFITWGVAYVFGLEIAIPGMQWVADPIISTLDKAAVKAILTFISKSVIMEGFFINTAIRKASQAEDYISAINVKKSLPTTATDQEYANAESKEMLAFRNFVMVTN